MKENEFSFNNELCAFAAVGDGSNTGSAGTGTNLGKQKGIVIINDN